MTADPKLPTLSVEPDGAPGRATVFIEDGAIGGHLAVDEENRVVFVPDDPGHGPEKE